MHVLRAGGGEAEIEPMQQECAFFHLVSVIAFVADHDTCSISGYLLLECLSVVMYFNYCMYIS